MTDLRNIKTQEDLENLFKKTNFVDDDHYSELVVHEPEDDYQFVWIPECCFMGSMSPMDCENSGYDALFLQTVVQMFKSGKLVVLEEL